MGPPDGGPGGPGPGGPERRRGRQQRGFGGRGPGGFGPRSQPGQILSPSIIQTLKLTDYQKKDEAEPAKARRRRTRQDAHGETKAAPQRYSTGLRTRRTWRLWSWPKRSAAAPADLRGQDAALPTVDPAVRPTEMVRRMVAVADRAVLRMAVLRMAADRVAEWRSAVPADLPASAVLVLRSRPAARAIRRPRRDARPNPLPDGRRRIEPQEPAEAATQSFAERRRRKTRRSYSPTTKNGSSRRLGQHGSRRSERSPRRRPRFRRPAGRPSRWRRARRKRLETRSANESGNPLPARWPRLLARKNTLPPRPMPRTGRNGAVPITTGSATKRICPRPGASRRTSCGSSRCPEWAARRPPSGKSTSF